MDADLASPRLTSLLAFIWLYLDKIGNEPVSQLSMYIFWERAHSMCPCGCFVSLHCALRLSSTCYFILTTSTHIYAGTGAL